MEKEITEFELLKNRDRADKLLRELGLETIDNHIQEPAHFHGVKVSLKKKHGFR